MRISDWSSDVCSSDLCAQGLLRMRMGHEEPPFGMSRRVAIVGATGVTGGYALDAAQRLGLMHFAVGRDASRPETFLAGRALGRYRLRPIDIRDRHPVKEAMHKSEERGVGKDGCRQWK